MITWRENELSMKEFQFLPTREEKNEYVLFLQSLPEEQLSTNDFSILRLETRNYNLKQQIVSITAQKKYTEIYEFQPPTQHEVLIKKKEFEVKHNLNYYRELIDKLIEYPNWNQHFILMGLEPFMEIVEELYPEVDLPLLREYLTELDKL